jgi:hypothetical protein
MLPIRSARMAELVDAVDSKSTAPCGHASSTLAPSTRQIKGLRTSVRDLFHFGSTVVST